MTLVASPLRERWPRIFGLAPRRHQLGTSMDYEGRISKQGDVAAREALCEAAASLLLRVRKWSALRAWAADRQTVEHAVRDHRGCAEARQHFAPDVGQQDRLHVGFGAKVSPAPCALSRPQERTSWCNLSALDLRSHSSGSLPTGAKTRPPSARSTATIPSGGRTRLRRTCVSAALSASTTWASFARFFCPMPNCARQRNSSPVTIPCLRATADTLVPGCSVSLAMRASPRR